MRKFKIPILLGLGILIYIIFMLQFFSAVPQWDASINEDYWIKKAITSPFNILNFDNAGHPAFIWMFIMGSLQYIEYGNLLFLHGSVLFFSLLCIYSFWVILNKLFIDKNVQVELLLVTAIYTFFPIVTSSAIHINQDYGVLVFFLIFFSFIIQKKWRMAVISSIGLIFSKEPGIVIYLLVILLIFISDLIKIKVNLHAKVYWIRKYIYFSVPPLLFLIRLGIRSILFPDVVFWQGINPFKGNLQAQYNNFPYDVIAKIPFSYFNGIFLIQFNWILSIGLVIGIVLFFYKLLLRKHVNIHQKGIVMISLLFIILTILFFQFRTFTNLRYFLPLYPLMIILFYLGLYLLFQKFAKVRIIILILVFILFFISEFRLIDPVSKKIYGTFKFGKHDMLKMTSLTGECCGYGRDQLVYNMQFLEFGYIQNLIFRDIKPNEDVGFVYDEWAGPEIISRLDNDTYLRTLKESNSFYPKILNWTFDYENKKPKLIYFIEFPNMVNSGVLTKYLSQYKLVSKKEYSENGYSISVYKLEHI